MTEYVITPELIAEDFENQDVLLKLQEIAEDQLEKHREQETDLEKFVEYLDERFNVMSDVLRVWKGQPILETYSNMFTSFALDDKFQRYADVMKMYAGGLVSELDTMEDASFGYVVRTKLGYHGNYEFHGQNNYWTLEQAYEAAYDYIATGEVPTAKKVEYYIYFNHMLADTLVEGRNRIGNDRVHAEKMLIALNEMYGANSHRLIVETINP